MRAWYLPLLALLILVQSQAPNPARDCPPAGGRDDPTTGLLSCMTGLLDTNPADGNVTAVEIDEFIAANSECLPNLGPLAANVTGSAFVELCDMNADEVLTVADWNHANGCVRSPARQHYVCVLCRRCGHTFGVTK